MNSIMVKKHKIKIKTIKDFYFDFTFYFASLFQILNSLININIYLIL